MGLLKGLQGFAKYSEEELPEILYQHRFELLGLSKVVPGFTYESLLSTRELHEALTSGQFPKAPQCMAHLLQPEKVPWPLDEVERERPAATPELVLPVKARAPSHGRPRRRREESSSSSSSPRHRASDLQRGRSDHSLGRKPLNRMQSAEMDADEGPEELPQFRRAHHVEEVRSTDMTQHYANRQTLVYLQNSVPDFVETFPRLSGGIQPGPDISEESMQHKKGAITICGQRVWSTVRGHPVPNAPEVEAIQSEVQADQELEELARVTAAVKRRERIERELRLQQCQEQQLERRLKDLEITLGAELHHQELLRAREASRKVRREELTEQIRVGVERMLEREKVERAEREEKKKREEKAEERRRLRNELQKKEVERWKKQKEEDPLPKVEKEPPQRTPRQHVPTLKEAETELRIRLREEAEELRPPMAPRPHDLRGYGRKALDNLAASVCTASPEPSHMSTAKGWVAEGRAIARAYGLSPREHGEVESTVRKGRSSSREP